MHRLMICLLLTGLGAGCAKKPPVARPASNPAGLGGGGLVPNAVEGARLNDGPTYQGRSVTQWADDLASRDPSRREQAGQALRALGDGGYRSLVQAMQSATPEIRVEAIKAMDQALWVGNAKETIPLLVRLVSDPDATVREQVAIRLAWFDGHAPGGVPRAGPMAAERLQALEALAAKDPQKDVRAAAARSVAAIRGAMDGKAVAD